MKDSIRTKLETLSDRFEEVGVLLSTPEVIGNQNRFRALSIEYAELEPVVQCFARYRRALDDVGAAEQMLKDPDADMRAMAQDELAAARDRSAALELELQKLLLPTDPYDDSNIFLEIRAGTGGDEAAIFAGDLFRMYARYAELRRWQVEVLSDNPGEHGGQKPDAGQQGGGGPLA